MGKLSSDIVDGLSYFKGVLQFNEVDEVHFRGCDFSHVTFESGADAVFEHCRFEACDFTNASLPRVSMLGSKFDGCVFLNTILDEAQFIESDITDPAFVNCSLYGAQFVDVDLTGGTLGGCDARHAAFVGVDVAGTTFDDTDLSDADLSAVWGLTDAQLGPANGNAKTRLPEDVNPPEEWLIDDEDQTAQHNPHGIPGQVAAPLKVTWRNDKLVPDSRGDEEQWRNSSAMTLFQGVREDVRSFLDNSPTNHPVGVHIKRLAVALGPGLSALNPVTVGYNVELIKAQLPGLEQELSASTAGSVRAIVVGGELLASQFAAWQEIVANRDALTSDSHTLQRASDALQSIASSMRSAPQIFDQRVAAAMEEQAADIKLAPDSVTVQKGAARSGANVFSALASRLWSGSKSIAKTAAQETVKHLIEAFFKANEAAIEHLIQWAPGTLSWLKQFLTRVS